MYLLYMKGSNKISSNYTYIYDYKFTNISNINELDIFASNIDDDLNYISNIKYYFPNLVINYFVNDVNPLQFAQFKGDNLFLSQKKIIHKDNNIIYNSLNKPSNIFVINKIDLELDEFKYQTKYKILNSPIFSKKSFFYKKAYSYRLNYLKIPKLNYFDQIKLKEIFSYKSNISLYNFHQQWNNLQKVYYNFHTDIEKFVESLSKDCGILVNQENSKIKNYIIQKYNLNNSKLKKEKFNKFINNSKESYFFENISINNFYKNASFHYIESSFNFDHERLFIKNESNFSYFKVVNKKKIANNYLYKLIKY